MQQGVLYFERQTERMDIRFENKEIYGGLHCGTAMEVLINPLALSTETTGIS